MSRSRHEEHGIPHFHASYAGQSVAIAIETGEPIAGSLPQHTLRLVREWSEVHRYELQANW